MTISELCEALVRHWDTLARDSSELWPSPEIKEAAEGLDYAARETLILALEEMAVHGPSVLIRLEKVSAIGAALPELEGEPAPATEAPPTEIPDLARWLVIYWRAHPRVSPEPAPLWPSPAAREAIHALDRKQARRLVEACQETIRSLPGEVAASRATAQLTVLRAAFAMRGIRVGF